MQKQKMQTRKLLLNEKKTEVSSHEGSDDLDGKLEAAMAAATAAMAKSKSIKAKRNLFL